MIDLELTRIFVKVAQNSSFTKAADILKLPKSTVSKAITRLEKETGTKLMTRTTRSLTLTAAGRGFYEASLGPLQLIEDAQKSLFGKDSMLSGLVRITAPEDLGVTVIAPVIAKLATENPQLHFELQYTDKIIDLVKDGFDLAVRIGPVNESSFKVKRVGEVKLITVASPKYLKDKGVVTEPKDLSEHDCLSFSGVSRRWSLKSSKKTIHIPVRARIATNHMSSLLNLALNDAGIALIPTYLCESDLQKGNLVRVLPQWESSGLPVSMISPLGSSSSVRLKLSIEQIASALVRALKV